jgi:PAS domain S-box-containing protein
MRGIMLRNMLIAVGVPLVLLSVSTALTTSGQIRHRIMSENKLILLSIEQEVNEYLDKAVSSIQFIGGSLLQEESIRTYGTLESVAGYFHWFEKIMIISESGTVLHTLPEDAGIIGNNYSGSPFFDEVRSGSDIYFSDTLISTGSYSPSLIISIPSGERVVAAYLDLSVLQEIADDSERFSGRHFILTDKRGTVIASDRENLNIQRRNLKNLEPVQAALRGASGSWKTDFEDLGYLVDALPVSSTGWPLLVLYPQSEAYRPLYGTLLTSFILCICMIPIAVILTLSAGKRISQPIELLTRRADSIAGGSYHHKSLQGYREIEILDRTMRTMAAEIETREEALQTSEQNYRYLLEHAAAIIIRWNKDKQYTYYNDFAARFFGLDENGGSLGKRLRELPLLGEEFFDRIWADPHHYAVNLNIDRDAEGRQVWIQWSNRPVFDDDGRLVEILSAGTDISDMKQIQQRLTESLAEREALLREIHHRVKNNLQVIISLLNLKASMLPESRERESIRESISHIYSISLVHEQLHLTPDLSSINLEEYFQDMVSYLSNAFPETGTVGFIIESDHIRLPIDQAVPCGLIVMECASNSLRHAFPPERRGEIRISAGMERDEIMIRIADNGRGFPEALFEESQSLGFQMIRVLADQLRGTLTFSQKDGSTFVLTFPAVNR